MRKLLASTFVSLDGVMQAPGGKDEDPSSNFDLGGWSFPFYDEVIDQAGNDQLASPFALLLGRKTYEFFASFWPTAPAEIDATARFNAATKYVASRTLKELTWGPAELLGDDIVARIQELKQEEGPDLYVSGSGNLLQTLFAHNLVDEFRLLIHPIVLGKGKRLFEQGLPPARYTLVDSKISSSGVILATYHIAGEVQRGSFRSEEA